MNPNPYLAAVRRSWIYAVCAIVIGTLAGLVLSLVATPLYSATATVYFSSGFSTSATDLNQGSDYAQAQMLSFAELAKSPAVLTPVIASLDLNTTPRALAGTIDATTPQGTVVLDITAASGKPSLAADVANAVAGSLIANAEQLAPAATGKSKPLTASVVGPATVPTSISSPDTSRNVLAGLVIGLVAAILIVVLRQQYDTRVVSAAAVAAVTDAPLLATVEKRRVSARVDARWPARGVVVGSTLWSGAVPGSAESYRQLGASLMTGGTKGGKHAILVTSALPGEGKSVTALGLAIALSERGGSVLLVDGNLRRPALADLLGVDGTVGLTEVLDGRAEFGTAFTSSVRPGLDFLAAGSVTAASGALLSSPAMAALVKTARIKYTALVVDAAPTSVAADAAILGALLDGAVVVVDSTKVHAVQLASALSTLDASHVCVLGMVLNRAHPHRHHYGPPPRPGGGSPASRLKTEPVVDTLTDQPTHID
ncbi:MAG: P-loop NTPase [Lacisediminihabitans sp.]